MPPSSPGPTLPLPLIQNPNPNPTSTHSIPIFERTPPIQMEGISERERILLGQVPRDPFTGAAVSLRRTSDVDFHDVFGGPPRRSSIYEPCRSRVGSIDSCRRGRDESVESRRSRPMSGENPVFRDGGGSGRRRQLRDDFFSDIFQSSESGCSSPRTGDRDPFLSSAPGSRVLSPNQPTSLSCEMLLAGSPLPAHASLSVKLANVLDHPAFASPSHRSVYNSEDGRSDMCSFPSSPNALFNGFTPQFMVGHDELRSDAHVSYTQSLLPRQLAFSFESSSEDTDPTGQAIKSQIGTSSSSLETCISNGRFHFSIYKWAGKGVILVMPSNSKETKGYGGKVKNIPEIIVQDFVVPTHCDCFSPVTKVSETRTVTQQSKSANDNGVDRKEDDYVTPAEYLSVSESDPKILQDEQNEISEKFGDQIEKVSILVTDKNSNTSNAHGKQIPDFKFNSRGEQNPEIKGSGDMPRQAKESETASKDNKKQELLRDSPVAYGEARRAIMIDTPSFSEDKTRGHKVKGKVKEFIKKFSLEVSPKQNGTSKMRDLKSRGKDNIVDKVNILAQTSSEADKLQTKCWNNNTQLLDIPNIMENEIMENAEDKSSITCAGHMIVDLPSERRNETMHPSSETTLEVLDNAAWSEEIIHEEIEGFLVQQLSPKETEGVQNNSQQDHIKSLDSKVREWSKGKQGNIRSLLSTLQYVLWSESGWKQVPLADIIEGPSVKKAYQRALLLLHPDKLQQKGASSNQKYIAEKVLNILQEAWDLLNPIGQF